MRKEDFCEVFGEIDETYVKEARLFQKEKKPVWMKWHMMAACFAVILIAGSIGLNKRLPAGGDMPQQSGKTLAEEGETLKNQQENYLFVNRTDTVMSADMDVKPVYYDGKMSESRWMEVQAEFQNLMGMTYDEFVKRLPASWEIDRFYGLETPGYETAELKKEYALHDYVFSCQTGQGGAVKIALCAFEEPLRDWFIQCDNPKQSWVNRVPLVIYGYGNSYLTQFSYQGLNYDITAENITEEELEELLLGILKTKEEKTEDR